MSTTKGSGKQSTHEETIPLGEQLSLLSIALQKKGDPVMMADATKIFKSFFNALENGFCVSEAIRDSDGRMINYRFIDVNPAFEKLTGLTPQQTIGKTAWDILGGLDPKWFEIYQHVVDSKETFRSESYIDPLHRWYAITAFYYGKEQFAVYFDDITKRKEAEIILQASEKKQRFLLTLSDKLRNETRPDNIAAVALQTLVAEMNLDRCYVCTMDFVNDTADMIRQYVAPGLDPVPESLKLSDFPEAVTTTVDHTLVYNDIAHDNQLTERDKQSFEIMKYGALLAAPLRKGEKKPIWVLAAATIGPRKWTKPEIALIEDAAERIWTAMERARVSEELLSSESELTKLLSLRDEFIGIASHELKTPMTSIKAYTELTERQLQNKGLTEEAELLQRVQKQIDRLNRLINDLLDTTQLGEGRLTYNLAPTNINELIFEQIDVLRGTSSRIFDVELGELPMVNVDQERIGQVMTNLLSNAMKYSPADAIITVKSWATEKQINITVADKGYGMTEDEQSRVFERFYRVTSREMSTFPGLGLGLYISAQIIERHGGTLSVKSVLGVGSVFEIELPVK